MPTPNPEGNIGNNPNSNSSVAENVGEAAKWVGIGTAIYWVISETSRIIITSKKSYSCTLMYI